jgi:hypothetical protein
MTPTSAASAKPASVPVCNGCLRKPPGRIGSACTRDACPHHKPCALCGRATEGRFILTSVVGKS